VTCCPFLDRFELDKSSSGLGPGDGGIDEEIYPASIQVDQGSEFTSRDPDL